MRVARPERRLEHAQVGAARRRTTGRRCRRAPRSGGDAPLDGRADAGARHPAPDSALRRRRPPRGSRRHALRRRRDRRRRTRARSSRRWPRSIELHMRPALAGIDAVSAECPTLLQVAAFDTVVSRDLPAAAAGYALPFEWSERWGLKRFGFHGLSVQYSVEQARRLLGRMPAKLIVCHLGSGCSITAVADGKSLDTTMGFSPLDGVMMATRAGSVDPGLILYLQARCGVGLDELQGRARQSLGPPRRVRRLRRSAQGSRRRGRGVAARAARLRANSSGRCAAPSARWRGARRRRCAGVHRRHRREQRARPRATSRPRSRSRACVCAPDAAGTGDRLISDAGLARRRRCSFMRAKISSSSTRSWNSRTTVHKNGHESIEDRTPKPCRTTITSHRGRSAIVEKETVHHRQIPRCGEDFVVQVSTFEHQNELAETQIGVRERIWKGTLGRKCLAICGQCFIVLIKRS